MTLRIPEDLKDLHEKSLATQKNLGQVSLDGIVAAMAAKTAELIERIAKLESHDNHSRPPTDFDHLQRQVSEILAHCNQLAKRETDPTEAPKDLYDEEKR